MILSIDPSLTHTAVLALEDNKIVRSWVIVTKPSKERFLTASEKDAERLQYLVMELSGIITETTPSLILAEQSLGATQSAVATKALGLVAGVMSTLATLKYGGAPWQFIRVHDVKRAFTGKPNATKLQMIEQAAKLFPELKEAMKSTKPSVKWNGNAEHLADAAAVYTAWKKMGNTLKGGTAWSMSSGALT